MHLRVLTFNIQNDQGDPCRLDLINTELRRLAPDLVAFQEIKSGPDGGQLRGLLDGTGLTGTHQADIAAVAPPFSEQYGGCAVASRWPHEIVEVLDLRMADALDVPWQTLAAVVHLPGGRDVLFIATTTSWRLDAEAARERQVAAIADLDARHRQPLPTIIAGDFNAGPDAASIRYLTGRQSLAGRSVHYHDSWEVAGDGPGDTWTVDNSSGKMEIDQVVRQANFRRRFDYVFVGSAHAHPKAHCKIVKAALAFDQPMDGLPLSDHYGVVVDLEIGNEMGTERDNNE
jgi:endonuclease/exonuclease/phosphatase family metal-dependent hydrolase